jgi:hypothetical protein
VSDCKMVFAAAKAMVCEFLLWELELGARSFWT